MSEINRDELAETLFQIATQLARRYHGWRAIDQDELVQETILNLMPFIESYQGEDVYLFGLVDKEIRHAAYHLYRKGKAIPFSHNDYRLVFYITRTENYMVNALGYEPTASEIAYEMRMPTAICRRVLEYSKLLSAISLDAPLYDDDLNLGNLVADQCADVYPEQKMFLIDLHEQIMRVLRTLEPLEKTTIQLRYGFIDNEVFSQQETAKELNISLDDERMTEIQAMRKLRHPSRSKYLEPFLY